MRKEHAEEGRHAEEEGRLVLVEDGGDRLRRGWPFVQHRSAPDRHGDRRVISAALQLRETCIIPALATECA